MRLIRQAAKIRRRAIAANRSHPEDGLIRPTYPKGMKRKMPAEYRDRLRGVLKTRRGRKAERRRRLFWGTPYPTEIAEFGGSGRRVPMAGMGRTTEVMIAPKRGARPRRIRGSWAGAFDSSGRVIYLFTKRGLPPKPRWRFVGYAAETHYLPTAAIEKAGSHKRGKYWVHEHADEGGKWPKVFQDQWGNFRYGKGTYKIGKWIRK
jgi:hypothetical protein